ncbi:hypothetical protein GCM10010238_39310 [Streptomyces griseoviridis]|uniref:Uncharacterized protein n=1 Tax=Streptomyces griseoviridis TaxID=45398 RepID=A0A918LG72_STRGD|nr:hypothetical protein GCM10010238_39310 [Streptomyces niveoruber]
MAACYGAVAGRRPPVPRRVLPGSPVSRCQAITGSWWAPDRARGRCPPRPPAHHVRRPTTSVGPPRPPAHHVRRPGRPVLRRVDGRQQGAVAGGEGAGAVLRAEVPHDRLLVPAGPGPPAEAGGGPRRATARPPINRDV